MIPNTKPKKKMNISRRWCNLVTLLWLGVFISFFCLGAKAYADTYNASIDDRSISEAMEK